jgi:phosphatidylethanolamine/phosphatidyl-N-methylethanolamine N-methyltransferase
MGVAASPSGRRLRQKGERGERRVSIAGRIGDEFRFIKRWVKNPKNIGAVSPSSRALARLMVRQAAPDPAGYTLELGPGTGVVTQAIIAAGVPPERIIAVEHSPDFCRLLHRRFPRVNVVQGDAFDLATTLSGFGELRFSAALSGLPLLSFPRAMRIACIEGVLDRLEPGGRLIQFSYGLHGPLDRPPHDMAVTRSKWVILNLPPARAWTFTRRDRAV